MTHSPPIVKRICLLFVRINQLGRPLKNGRGFSKISKPTERSRNCFLPADERLKTGKFSKSLSGNFRHSVPHGKRGLPLEVVYNLRPDFKKFIFSLLFHLTFNRNFRIFLLNDCTQYCLRNLKTQLYFYTLIRQ